MMTMATRHQPSGLPGLRQATTKPTTPKGTAAHHSPPPVPATTLRRARLAAGQASAIRASTTHRAASTVAGEASLSRRVRGAAAVARTGTGFPSLISRTVRPERSGNVTAGDGARTRPRVGGRAEPGLVSGAQWWDRELHAGRRHCY